MRRLAVLGHPVAHSRSPAMQNAALAELGLGDQWHYEAIDIAPEDFVNRVATLPSAGFVGANVTVPHKEAALALADSASAAARHIGAANTLSFRGGGVHADNTDAPGLIEALPDRSRVGSSLVLGAGGAARAVIWALLDAGAEVTVWNRTPDKAAVLCEQLGGRIAEQQLSVGQFELIVNASAAGLDGSDPFAALPLAPEEFRPGQCVVDMVYGAQPSPLLAAAERVGAATVDGLEILVCQGALSLEIWTGEQAPRQVMWRAARE